MLSGLYDAVKSFFVPTTSPSRINLLALVSYDALRSMAQENGTRVLLQRTYDMWGNPILRPWLENEMSFDERFQIFFGSKAFCLETILRIAQEAISSPEFARCTIAEQRAIERAVWVLNAKVDLHSEKHVGTIRVVFNRDQGDQAAVAAALPAVPMRSTDSESVVRQHDALQEVSDSDIGASSSDLQEQTYFDLVSMSRSEAESEAEYAAALTPEIQEEESFQRANGTMTGKDGVDTRQDREDLKLVAAAPRAIGAPAYRPVIISVSDSESDVSDVSSEESHEGQQALQNDPFVAMDSAIKKDLEQRAHKKVVRLLRGGLDGTSADFQIGRVKMPPVKRAYYYIKLMRKILENAGDFGTRAYGFYDVLLVELARIKNPTLRQSLTKLGHSLRGRGSLNLFKTYLRRHLQTQEALAKGITPEIVTAVREAIPDFFN